jgi:trans-aconitate methyltransferase
MNYEEEFDLVTSFFMLQWVEDLRAIVTKMYAALKPDGRMLLFYPIMHLHPWHNIVLKEMKASNWGKRYEELLPQAYFNEDGQKNQLRHCCHEQHELSEMCQQIGFKDVSVEINNHTYTFVNENECVIWFEALITMINEPEDEVEQQLVQNVLRKIIQQFHQDDSGSISVRWTCVLIRGCK